MKPLDLAAGLGMIGSGVFGLDPEALELEFQDDLAASLPAGEDGAVVVRKQEEARATREQSSRATREQSSRKFKISTGLPSASVQGVASACQVSLGSLAAKRMKEDLGRFWGCGVTRPWR